MAASAHSPGSAGKVFLFGPQALSFDIASFVKLSIQLHEASNRWALDVVSTLSTVWAPLVKSVPKLQHANGEQLLKELGESLQAGKTPESLLPLPNILLSPLVVIAHLTQYAAFVRTALPSLADNDKLPSSVTENTETLGLCIGMLSAFAVSCSSSLAELEQHGAVAVRLAMLIGALVDAEEASPDSGGKSTSFSVSWNGAESGNSVNNVLEKFSEAYVSVRVDEKRSTVTASKSIAPALVQQLKSAGVNVFDVALSGRFHWPKHQEDVEKLIQFCAENPQFQFPDASKMVLSSRSETGGQYLTTGSLHEIVLRESLLKPSEWVRTFSIVYSSQLTADDSRVICFGPERCVPPTIARKLGSRLVNVSEIDLSTSPLPGKLLGQSTTPFFGDLPDDRIAVIGMSGHVPGAKDLEEFWKILAAGQSQHTTVPPERFNMDTPWRTTEPNRTWYGNFIDNYDTFDHKFFKKSPREMASTDPQHRVILKLAYQAIEQSGYFGVPDFDKHIGCYIGVGNFDYEMNLASHSPTAFAPTGGLKAFVSGKISHYFGWTGPSLTIDTACSSSSVAVHQACRAIINGECSTALAGGVNVFTNPDWFHNMAGGGFLSPTGQCKPFDAKGDGYCRGEGAGVVFLKKLSAAVADGDQIFGVIASTRVYQNQNCTAITVPNSISLTGLFKDVVRQARLEPQAVSVAEAHGTGTAVGDPAEYDGLRKALGGSIRSDTLHLSSVKGLIGHAEFSSGILSLLKILLMINEGLVPPQASFTSINPAIKSVPEDKIEIPTRLKPWDVAFRAALINNYGASGSNASMVVTQSPKSPSPKTQSGLTPTKSFPFWFCGLDERSLRAYVTKFRQFLQKHTGSSKDFSASNLSFQLSRQSNRTLSQTLIFHAKSSDDLDQKLAAFEKGDKSIVATPQVPARPVILAFGGQISTFIGLDKDIYDNVAVLKSHLDQCDAMCLSFGLDSIYPDIFQRSPIQDIVKLQTMLFAIQYSCAKAWIDSGVKVAAVVGHSFGELTGLCVAGAYSLKDALKLISGRASLIKKYWGADSGAMLAVMADLADVETLLAKARKASGSKVDPTIACYNGPKTFTLAGSTKTVQLAETLAKSDPSFSGMKTKMLNVTNAFHSALVDPLMGDLEVLGRELVFNKSAMRVERATEHSSTDKLEASFVAQHMRNPVFFNHAVQRLAKEFPAAIWLEAGSNSTITTMADRALGGLKSSHFQSVNVTSDGSFQFLVDTTTKLWKEGLNISFWGHNAKQVSEHTPVVLPPYQFEEVRHWMDIKEPPKLEVPVVQQVQPIEAPKGLTAFIGYQDQAKRSARFQVNTALDRFQRLTKATWVVNTATMPSSMLQLDIVLDALMQLRPEFKDLSFQPELQGMSHKTVLVPDSSKTYYLDAVSREEGDLVWQWKLSATDSAGVSTEYTSGTTVFRPVGDSQLIDNYESLARLSGRKRCVNLLKGNDADEVLQGRNIYRAFEQVIDWKEPYRNVTKIAGKDNESAGRITRKYDGEAWIDSVLSECFCQVAAMYVNIMTDTLDLSERGIYICDKIDRWIRNPKLGVHASLPETWEVFAVHHQDSETKYVSDVFAFDARDGSLVEVILGISYQKVPMEGIRRAFSRAAGLEPQRATAAAAATKSAPPQVQAPQPSTASADPAPAPSKKSKKEKTAKKASPKSSGPDIIGKTREIVCNLSGIDAEEIKIDSDLIELGIDSLMAMEVVREVDAAFKVTLSNDQLMAMTTFQHLVSGIRSALGLEDQEEEGAPEEESSDEEDEAEAEPKTTAVDVHTNGTNDTNETNVANGVNGFHETNGVDETKETNGSNRLNGYYNANGINGVNGVNGFHATNGVNGVDSYSSPTDTPTDLPVSAVVDAFREVKWTTDGFIVKEKLGDFYNRTVPKSTELCVVYFINALEQLGCPLRSATQGQHLKRVSHLPKHDRYVELMYKVLEHEARLIDINGSEIIRTAVAPPLKSAETLLEELLRDEPAHAAEHKLIAIFGPKLADCLTGREEAARLFDSSEGRETMTDAYANTPAIGTWIHQFEHFLEKLIGKLAKRGDTLNILEMGAGTGGKTSKLVPMLARIGMPFRYTFTDPSPSLVAAARKRFQQYPFMEFKVLEFDSEPDSKLSGSQHIILSTHCAHAMRSLPASLAHIHRMLRPDGFLMLQEATEQLPWLNFVFGLEDSWWSFEDDRSHVLAPISHWEKTLHTAGYGHVDWTEGDLPEANIQRLIIAHASGPRFDRGPKPYSPPPPPEDVTSDAPERQAVVDAYIRKYTQDFRAPSKNVTAPSNPPRSGKCMLVTGATGSLGSHIVACLAQLPDVHTVVCLNRLSNVDPLIRQQKSLEMRDIKLDSKSLAKLNVIDTDTSKPMLGLTPETYEYLVHNLTHIVHSAWPMSLTRALRGYEIQFKVFRNLIDLARNAVEYRPAPFRFGFQFVSSIATVGNYFLWTGKAYVPETTTTVESVPKTGYAEAKLICEHILNQTLYRHPDRFHPMVARIAQISGSTNNGYWNPTEYMPFLIKSSQVLRVLPDLDGDLSWTPVDQVASTLADLLTSATATDLVYHVDNPSRQNWKDMIATIGRALNLGPGDVVPHNQWVDRVRRFRSSINDNPASQLITYFELWFVPMSCGDLILDVTKTSKYSETLRTMKHIDDDLMMRYINAWKQSGFMHP